MRTTAHIVLVSKIDDDDDDDVGYSRKRSSLLLKMLLAPLDRLVLDLALLTGSAITVHTHTHTNTAEQRSPLLPLPVITHNCLLLCRMPTREHLCFIESNENSEVLDKNTTFCSLEDAF